MQSSKVPGPVYPTVLYKRFSNKLCKSILNMYMDYLVYCHKL